MRLCALRWILIPLASGFYVAYLPVRSVGLVGLGLGCMLLALGLNWLVFVQLRRQGRVQASLALLEQLVLGGMVGLAVYLTGGLESPLVILLAYAAVVACARPQGPSHRLWIVYELVLALLVLAPSAYQGHAYSRLLLVLITLGCLMYFGQLLAQAEARERRAALTDPLTGLANRRQVQQAFARLARTGGQRVALAVVDVDDLKGINDRFGHQHGDRTIVALARRLQAIVGPGALLARWGGDEFVVLATGEAAASLEARLAQLDVPARGHEPQIASSWGVACGTLPEASFDELFDAADAMLYERKHRRAEPPPAATRSRKA